MFDLILKNAMNVSSQTQKKQDVAIKDGKIAKVAELIEDEAKEVIDLTGKYLLPGVIDSQVHFREPGLVHKEDLETGSRAAALGGITTFFEMPNTNPATTTKASIEEKLEIARSKCITNYQFYVGATAENLDDLIEATKVDGCCGIKIFLGSSTGDLLLYEDEKLKDIFKNTTGMIACHSENEVMLRERLPIKEKATSPHEHPVWRDEQTALTSTQKLIGLARECNRKVHVLHITTKEEMEFLAENKDVCTVEVTPQHLTLSAPECYDNLGTYAQMNPPIRSADHTQGLWKGIQNKTVDVIGSDHAPHTREEKDKGYPNSPSGMPGVQTLLPIMLDHVNNGRLDLQHLVKLVCENPADLWDLNKGYVEVGRDADITIVDLNKTHMISNNEQASKCGWTPFHGRKITGMPIYTIVRGEIVMKNGDLLK